MIPIVLRNTFSRMIMVKDFRMKENGTGSEIKARVLENEMEEHVKYYPIRAGKEALKGIQKAPEKKTPIGNTGASKTLLSPFLRISPELSSAITT